MPACSACGQENPDVARFCLACGTPLASDAPGPRSERRIVSVIFVDLVGFTGAAEKLDPEDVQAVLEPYHEAVRQEIESFGGVVEKFIGDAIMGVFGAPTAYGDDPERAVRAALAVRDRVAGDTLQLRIAVNTGEALVQLNTRPELGEAMVAGDVVNTAARLQSATSPNTVIVGEETWRTTRDVIRYEDGEDVVAKGKEHALPTWVAVCAAAPEGERPLSSTFVGRARELAALHDVWERVREQRTPHLVTVVAAAGVGKSRLGVEFARRIEQDGGFSVRGRTLPYRESSAYGAFASQLKQLCGVFESDAPEVAAAKLRETVGCLLDDNAAEEVARHLSILVGAADPTATVADRETLFFSIRVFIEAVARDRPTMLVFEDLHWADAGLLDLVELLAARLRDLPILLLVLARPDLLDARPGWGGGLPAATTLPLGALTADEAQELARERLSAGREIIDRSSDIAQMAAGNPLFIEQLAASVAEASGAELASLPATIRGLIAARLDALPQDERTVVLDAAVGGKVFWRGYLERLDGSRQLGELLGALERRDLVRRETVSAIEGQQQYTFTHVLIRDVAYDLLPRQARRARHEQCALFLEETTAEVGEAGAALARHWRDAGEREKALGYFARAAEQAEQGWAKDRAVTFYREALDLGTDEDQKRLLRRRLAVAQQAYMHLEDARALGLRRGLESYRTPL